MTEWMRHNWPFLVGLATSSVFLAQALFSIGATQAEVKLNQQQTETRIHQLTEQVSQHEDRPSHETTAIRLERIEVQQRGIAEDVQRMTGQLDVITQDLREAVRSR